MLPCVNFWTVIYRPVDCEGICVLTFGCFPSVCFILADGLEPSVRSIFKGLKEGSEMTANIKQTLGKHPKVNTVNTEHSESLKSRSICVYLSVLL
jgi:hypothetical protein